jgi:hypothetical protein
MSCRTSRIRVSYKVEVAVFMAAGVFVRSNRPDEVIGDDKLGIPRPRLNYQLDHLSSDTSTRLWKS